jgi:hypothetical protein
VRRLPDPTIGTRGHDLQRPHAVPQKSTAYQELERKAEQIRRRTGLKKEQAFAQAVQDHPELYGADAVARGMRQANENAGQVLSAATQNL